MFPFCPATNCLFFAVPLCHVVLIWSQLIMDQPTMTPLINLSLTCRCWVFCPRSEKVTKIGPHIGKRACRLYTWPSGKEQQDLEWGVWSIRLACPLGSRFLIMVKEAVQSRDRVGPSCEGQNDSNRVTQPLPLPSSSFRWTLVPWMWCLPVAYPSYPLTPVFQCFTRLPTGSRWQN